MGDTDTKGATVPKLTGRKAFQAGCAIAAIVVLSAGSTVANASEFEPDGSAIVSEIVPEALAGSKSLAADGTSFTAEAANASLSIPKDADQPIVLTDSINSVSISLSADISDDASFSGTSASFPHENGDSSVVNLTEDGGLRITSVIASEDSPERFAYVYDGVSLELFTDGGVLGFNDDGSVGLIVDLPWAYDATGAAVPTWYELDGNTLVQVVDHKSGAFEYPIVADPTNYGGNEMYQKITADADPEGGDKVSVYVGTYNFSHASNDAIWNSYKSLVPAKYEAETMKKQLLCHARNIGALKNPWNLETRRPNLSDWDFFVNACNPN
jgi:hypothetical protein